MRDRIVKGGLSATIARAATVIAVFLTTILLTRTLSPEDVGVYFAVVSAITLAASIGTLGVGTPLMAMLGDESSSSSWTRAVIRRGLSIALGGALLVSLVFLVGFGRISALFLNSSPELAWWALAGLASLLVVRGFFENVLRALAEIPGASLVGAVPSVLVAALLTALVIVSASVGLGSVLIVLAVANGLAAALGLGLVTSKLGPADVSTSPPAHSRLVMVGLPALGVSLLVYLAIQGAVLVVAATSGTFETALYGAASRIASFASIPFQLSIAVLPPFLVRYWSRGEVAVLERLMRLSATLTGCLAGVGLLVVVVVGRPLLGVLFGDTYTAAWGPLMILTASAAFDALLGQPAQLLLLTGHERQVMYVFGVSTPIALAVMWTLGGAEGAAIGLGVGTVLSNVALAYLGWTLLGVRAWATFSRRDLRDAWSIAAKRRP